MRRPKKYLKNIRKLLPVLNRSVDKLHDYVVEGLPRARPGTSITCASCTSSHCCYIKVAIPFEEAVLIADHVGLKWFTPERLAVAQKSFELMSKYGSDDYGTYYRPCIFLENGRCTIYSVRPSACRTYLVTTDEAKCDPRSRDEIVTVLAPLPEHQGYVDLSAKLAKEHEMMVTLGPLPGMVMYAMNFIMELEKNGGNAASRLVMRYQRESMEISGHDVGAILHGGSKEIL